MARLAIAFLLTFALTAWAQIPAKNAAGTSNFASVANAVTVKQPKSVSLMKLHGWVVDEVCGRVTGRTSAHANCARMCSRMEHRQLVFVSDYNGVNITVKNPGKLRPYMGKHLDIEARLLAPKTIKVVYVDPASANASPNDPVAAHDVLILPQTKADPPSEKESKKAK